VDFRPGTVVRVEFEVPYPNVESMQPAFHDRKEQPAMTMTKSLSQQDAQPDGEMQQPDYKQRAEAFVIPSEARNPY
jgi:hypothetical protein